MLVKKAIHVKYVMIYTLIWEWEEAIQCVELRMTLAFTKAGRQIPSGVSIHSLMSYWLTCHLGRTSRSHVQSQSFVRNHSVSSSTERNSLTAFVPGPAVPGPLMGDVGPQGCLSANGQAPWPRTGSWSAAAPLNSAEVFMNRKPQSWTPDL